MTLDRITRRSRAAAGAPMMRFLSDPPRVPVFVFTLAAVIAAAPAARAQYAERGALHGSGEPAVDVSGRSVKNPRVRAVHTTDPSLPGGTAYLLRRDPFLAYQLGRNLNFREFRLRDGVLDASVSSLGGPKLDGTTAKITTRNQTSCSGCHNQPYGTPGGGTSFAKDSGRGRQAPHYFGAGIVEMLALQVRTEIMLQIDLDGDGWISIDEARRSPDPIRVDTGTGRRIDYGTARLSDGDRGVPGLNRIFRVWYGKEQEDGSIAIAPGAVSIDGETATHFNFAMVVWGWGQLVPPSALNPTNRAFLWDPFKAHSGLEAHDPSTLDDPDGDGVSVPTLAGAVQFPATHRAPDAGATLDELGFSRDDPDGDGILTEISEGDLDLGEWFMLHAPRPAFAGTERQFLAGVKIMRNMGCTRCHVPEWRIRPRDEHFAGDRRVFDLDVRWNRRRHRLEGRLVDLSVQDGEDTLPAGGAFEVAGLFSDLRHHDMGERFAEIGYDGNVNTVWRTAPLWGAGSGFPWGHDGASLTLEDVILRHGGEAARSARRFARAGRGKREALIAFLRRLRLYDIESLPADVDGDGVIAEHFVVAGVDTGIERFNAEWLFRTPVAIQGLVSNDQGLTVRSFAATNLRAAYGLDLDLRSDRDLDGWPDVWDHAPDSPGFADGVDN